MFKNFIERGIKMILEYDGVYKSHEIKESSNGKQYAVIEAEQVGSKYLDKIFVFNKKVVENLGNFEAGEQMIVLFNRFYNSKEKREVIIVKDVVMV